MTDRASQCAASVQLSEDGDSESGSHVLISSALALIIQTARFVEEKCREDSELGLISLAVLAKTKRTPDSAVQEYRLYGPRLLSTSVPRTEVQGLRKSQDENEGRVDAHSVVLQDHEADGLPVRRRTEDSPGRDAERLVPPSARLLSEEDASINEGGEPSLGTPPEQVYPRSKQDPFNIKEGATAKCLSLLLDGSGITAHPSCYRYRTIAHVPALVLKDVIRKMMEVYKIETGSSSKDIKYSSLLPKELRDRSVTYNSLTLIRSESDVYVSGPVVDVVLTVKKPDRNKKEVHFAMFAALIQVDPDGICANQLNKLAAEGMGPSGCSRKPGTGCGGPRHCIEADVSPITEFFNESNETVESGEVYPSVSYLRGKPVPCNMVVVRFKSRNVGKSKEKGNSFSLWKAELVSRHLLLDAYGSTVGSAIVGMHSPKSVAKGAKSSLCDLDISEAAVVCKIRIEEKHKTDPYFFAEWHQFGSSFQREVHGPMLPDNTTPQKLGDLEQIVSAFWHKKYLKKDIFES